MALVNSRFASVLESEILKIQEDAVPENTMKATKFGMKVFRGKRRLNIFLTSVLPFLTEFAHALYRFHVPQRMNWEVN